MNGLKRTFAKSLISIPTAITAAVGGGFLALNAVSDKIDDPMNAAPVQNDEYTEAYRQRFENLEGMAVTDVDLQTMPYAAVLNNSDRYKAAAARLTADLYMDRFINERTFRQLANEFPDNHHEKFKWAIDKNHANSLDECRPGHDTGLQVYECIRKRDFEKVEAKMTVSMLGGFIGLVCFAVVCGTNRNRLDKWKNLPKAEKKSKYKPENH